MIVWGSSYTGSLVFRLAAENRGKVSGVLAFSPAAGGPMLSCRARQWAGDIRVPAIVFKPASEMERESSHDQRRALEAADVAFRVIDDGIHGSSMLVDARTGHDMSAAREEVIAWLDGIQ